MTSLCQIEFETSVQAELCVSSDLLYFSFALKLSALSFSDPKVLVNNNGIG